MRVSPLVRLELEYLHAIGRVTDRAGPVLDELAATMGLRMCDAPFAAVVYEAETIEWTRDPFDRLIVAQAALAEAPLVTKDETLHANYSGAVW